LCRRRCSVRPATLLDYKRHQGAPPGGGSGCGMNFRGRQQWIDSDLIEHGKGCSHSGSLLARLGMLRLALLKHLDGAGDTVACVSGIVPSPHFNALALEIFIDREEVRDLAEQVRI